MTVLKFYRIYSFFADLFLHLCIGAIYSSDVCFLFSYLYLFIRLLVTHITTYSISLFKCSFHNHANVISFEIHFDFLSIFLYLLLFLQVFIRFVAVPSCYDQSFLTQPRNSSFTLSYLPINIRLYECSFIFDYFHSLIQFRIQTNFCNFSSVFRTFSILLRIQSIFFVLFYLFKLNPAFSDILFASSIPYPNDYSVVKFFLLILIFSLL